MNYSLLLLLVFYSFISLSCSKLYISSHLTTKTTYDNSISQYNTTNPPFGYNLVHLDLLARHGARYATSGSMEDILTLQSHLSYYFPMITNSSFFWIKTWECNYCDMNQQGILTTYGESEHYNLGKSYLSKFPEIFYSEDGNRIPYSPNIYDIQSTVVTRTSHSGSAFTYGLWEGTGNMNNTNSTFQPIASWSDSEDTDTRLRFYDNCPLWEKSVHKNDTAVEQSTLWKEKMFPQVREAIGELLAPGEKVDWSGLTDDDLETIFDMCSYDLYILGIENQWCTFWPNDSIVEIVEYADDLVTYYERSYGYDLNYQMSCDLVSDILDSLKKVIEDDGTQTLLGKFRFAHSETFVPLLSVLGLYKDSFTLRADSSSDQIYSRLFKTSKISPYTCNIAFLLYTTSNQEDEPLVKIVINEQEVVIPDCGEEIYCPLSTLQTILEPYSSLNFTLLCSTSNDTSNDNGNSDDDDDDGDVDLIIVIFACFGSAIFGFMIAVFGYLGIRWKKDSVSYVN